MSKTLLIALVTLVVGIFAGVTLTRTDEPGAPVTGGAQADAARGTTTSSSRASQAAAEVDARLADLQLRLDDEIRARRQLEKRLRENSEQLARLEREIESRGEKKATGDTEEIEATPTQAEQAWFDEQALLDSGMQASLAGELRGFFEQLEMERLYLRDRSAREGWERGRLREEMALLDDRETSLRERLGDKAYDAYLYASGQTNRVSVSSVLETAQAGQAGIRAGDYILSYDNQRIYNWRDLRTATTQGEITDSVEIEVERDGETLQFYLARGPLGIRMNSLRVAP